MEYVKPAVINPATVNSAKCGDGPCGIYIERTGQIRQENAGGGICPDPAV